MIHATDVRKTFRLGGRQLDALKGVSLSVKQGEFVSIMGPSGAGKSTLLHIIGGLDRPTEGTVLVNDRNLFEMPEDELPAFRNRNIGFVFQFHYLLAEFTALENIMLAAMVGGNGNGSTRRKAEELLSQVGLRDRMEHKPGELSGGEQQRVALARALVTSPGLVLADEPTGNLDTRTGEDVFELLKRFNRDYGITFAMVTHNEALAAGCDRVIRMVDGQVRSQ